mmetsp:Transcript_18330/g.28154  ORF Transcript_18330/g.28154 Transcript_18330/m.28154 type:complete len:217 (-) Transcript_18330:106-756(-)
MSRSMTTAPLYHKKRQSTVSSEAFPPDEPIGEKPATDMEIVEYEFKPKTTSSSQVVYTSSKDEQARKPSEVSSHEGSFINETTVVNATIVKAKPSAAQNRYNVPTSPDLSDTSFPPQPLNPSETPKLTKHMTPSEPISTLMETEPRQLPQHQPLSQFQKCKQESIPMLLKFKEPVASQTSKKSPSKPKPVNYRPGPKTARASDQTKIDFIKGKSKI